MLSNGPRPLTSEGCGDCTVTRAAPPRHGTGFYDLSIGPAVAADSYFRYRQPAGLRALPKCFPVFTATRYAA